MDKIVIEGPTRLRGSVEVSGAKNSALPIMAATLLTDEKCVIKRVPPLRDVNTMIKILRNLGVKVQVEPGRLVIEPKGYKNYIAPYKYVKEMRASFCVRVRSSQNTRERRCRIPEAAPSATARWTSTLKA